LNPNNQPTIFIVADAFRHDYLKSDVTPNLCKLASRGTYARRLRPNFGFCERTEMFTGTTPDMNDFFTALTFADSGSAFKSIKAEILFWSLFDWKSKFMRRYIRRFYRDWFKKIRGITQPVYEIPLKLLPRIVLTEDERELHLPGWSEWETIFDVLRSKGKTFYFDTFCSLTMNMTSDAERVERICRILPEKEHDFYLVYVGAGDGEGHDFGPHGPEALDMNRRVDSHIGRISDVFFKNFPEGRFLVIGDHGMLEVKDYIDVDSKIFKAAKKAGIRHVKDFDYFLDSTLTRIWFKSPDAEKVFYDCFNNDKDLKSKGRILTDELARKFHVPPAGGRYGDLRWIANAGVLIFPDFFHYRNPCKGMHGYETHVSGQKGFAIAVGGGIPKRDMEEIDLIDICPTLSRMLDIPVPKNNCGESILS
jgi:type I phosphodiesterase/nucleotide pyrophosphatase